MNFDKLNQWLSLVANFGVLIGIVFLAIEMRQNTAMMQAQTRDAMTEKQMTFYSQILASPETTENFLTTSGYVQNFDLALAQSNNLYRSQLRMWENEWYQYQQGLFEDEEFVPRMNLWRTSLDSEAYIIFWNTIKDTHSPSFREQIDQIIAENLKGNTQ